MNTSVVKEIRFKEMEHFIIDKLRTELPANLYYHAFHHTIDVLKAAERLAMAEQISDDELLLLRTAVLYHDSGYIDDYKHHEEQGCKLVRATLPDFGYSDEQIERICGMIMASKVPQTPHNLLERIICDADLDYLGREDFWSIGKLLFKEFVEHGVVSDEESWNQLQIKFLESHTYFTTAAKNWRNTQKEQYIQQLKEIVKRYS